MEASGNRQRVRPIVVDLLVTLFYTFCIGVSTAVALGACVVLLAGQARGSEMAPVKTAQPRQQSLRRLRVPFAHPPATRFPDDQRDEAIFDSAQADATERRFQLLTGALAFLFALVLFGRAEGRQRGWSGRARGGPAIRCKGLRQALAGVAIRRPLFRSWRRSKWVQACPS